MKTKDQQLGMQVPISRRQFIGGMSVAAGLMSSPSLAKALSVADTSSLYPPLLDGLRGAHPGSFEAAHSVARSGQRWLPQETIAEHYDLVVVGAGISGLAAAYFYLRQKPQARILVLDNHDDFGGHAKRNEFIVNGRRLIAYGGSQSMEEPNRYSREASQLLVDLGVNLKKFESAFDQQFYTRHNMTVGMFFSQLGEKENLISEFSIANYSGDPLPKPSRRQIDALGLGESDGNKLYEILVQPKNYLEDHSDDAKFEILWTTSYRDYLKNHVGLSDLLLEMFKQITDGTFADAFDVVSAASAWGYGDMPGFDGLGIDKSVFTTPSQPYIHHFPDGNASIARLLVRRLIPTVAAGHTMEDVVTAKFDYSKLDCEEHSVRLRLNSTAVNVTPGDGNTHAKITYLNGGKANTVSASHCVLACNNGMVPFLIPELNGEQADALRYGVKAPLMYTNVALTNWQAFKQLGVCEFYCPDAFYSNVALDFPVSLGSYQFSQDPSQPIVVHMEHSPTQLGLNLSSRARYRLGRHQLLSMSYEAIERETRQQLQDLLGSAGFDASRDIAGITVNRWPHGYAYGYNELFDPEWEAHNAPHVIGRQRIGNVVIANSDAGAEAMMQAGIDQAYRAIQELMKA